MEPRVYIIILNFNNPLVTIDCLKSLRNLSYAKYKIILCDNCSTDNSIELFKQYTERDEVLHFHKKIIWKSVDNIGTIEGFDNKGLLIIENKMNLGYGAGNNIGIKIAELLNDYDYIWFLNNDTIVDKNSLTELVKRSQKSNKPGICGSTLLYPNGKIQSLGGGIFYKWFGTTKYIFKNFNYDNNADYNFAEDISDYVVGASMLVSNEYIRTIGVMSEEYFLYFEDVDWCIRNKGFDIMYAPKSLITHYEGATIGGNSNIEKNKSYISDYYLIKNRIFFTRKYYFYALPTVYLGLCLAIINRIRRKQWDRVIMIFRIVFWGK